MTLRKNKQESKLSELAESIKKFEDVHKKYNLFESDGSLTTEGWQWLHDAEEDWENDIKWNDYTRFHLGPRLGEYWYGESNSGEEADIEYYNAWLELHPNGKM